VLVAGHVVGNSAGVATDPSGQIYIADGKTTDSQVSSDGKTVITVAGAAIGAAGTAGRPPARSCAPPMGLP